MAEIFGFVSSGAGLASLALQLGNSALKIRRLYQSLRDAPAFLEDTAYDLETFSHALRNLERDRQSYNTVDYTVVERCVQTCERAVAKVRFVASHLESMMLNTKTWSRIRAAVDRPELDRLCDELERAKTSLGLALQLYTEACRKKDICRLFEILNEHRFVHSQQIQLLTAQGNNLEQVRTSLLGFPEATVRPGSSYRRQAGYTGESIKHQTPVGSKRRGRIRPCGSYRMWRLRFPPWSASRIWEISLDAAQEGWSINLRAASKVSPTALIFKACEDNDLALVRELFNEGTASPYDFYECQYVLDRFQTPVSVPVLAFAVHWGRLEICKYLIETGGHPVIPANSYPLRNAYAWRYLLSKRKTDKTEAVGMYQFLQDLIDWNPELDHLRDPSVHWSSKMNHFNFFKSQTDPLDYDLSLFTQGSFSPTISDWGEFRLTPVLALGIIRATSITSAIATSRDEQGRTAVHRLAVLCACTQHEPSSSYWVDFVRELLSFGADLHARSHEGITPLAALLEGQLPVELSQLVDPDDLQGRLHAWMHLLELAGLDLVSYGQTELEIWKIEGTGSKMPFKKTGSYLYRRVEGFVSGAQSEQWSVYFGLFIPVYELHCLPGTWPTGAKQSTKMICWQPREEDTPDMPWYWKQNRFVRITSHIGQTELVWESLSAQDSIYDTREALHRGHGSCGTLWPFSNTTTIREFRSRSYSEPASLKENLSVSEANS